VPAVPQHLKGRDFTRVADWSGDELVTALALAEALKAAHQRRETHALLPGRTLGMIFQKPSTRTRVSFEVGIAQLGGVGLSLAAGDLQLGRGETIKDTANVLSRYLDAIMIRTFAQSDVEELAEHASVPVINGLTDAEHPCQALADLQTVRERHGRLEGIRFAYVGDGNNVCVSLAEAARLVGMSFVAATPPGYEPPLEAVELTHDPREAAAGADVLYTDVWTSMGQEAERDHRVNHFSPFQVNASLMAAAPKHARLMHCLPAHRGEEIAADVIDGPHSVVFDQAENRLHAQKALLCFLLGARR
jgi:ornithine carbamoyltransferase